MEYVAEFTVYSDGQQPISREVLNSLTKGWVDMVEDMGLCTGGGVRERCRLDNLVDTLWIWLWRLGWVSQSR